VAIETAATADAIEQAGARALRSAILSERAWRIARLARWIATFDELKETPCNLRATTAAAWFQDAWIAEAVAAGRRPATDVLTIEPKAADTERAADLLVEHAAPLLEAATRAAAVGALRRARDATTQMGEAIALAEATNLDALGPMWVWGQAVRAATADRPIATVVALWERQADYGYWPKRIAATLRFRRSRMLAETRCAAIEGFLMAVRDQLHGSDRV